MFIFTRCVCMFQLQCWDIPQYKQIWTSHPLASIQQHHNAWLSLKTRGINQCFEGKIFLLSLNSNYIVNSSSSNHSFKVTNTFLNETIKVVVWLWRTQFFSLREAEIGDENLLIQRTNYELAKKCVQNEWITLKLT